MPSFQATVLGEVERRACRREMPKRVLAAPPSCATLSNSSAAWISALEGMQPTLRQVPPGLLASTITVSMPSWPARMAQT